MNQRKMHLELERDWSGNAALHTLHTGTSPGEFPKIIANSIPPLSRWHSVPVLRFRGKLFKINVAKREGLLLGTAKSCAL